jgi:hypothetical protein
MNGHEIKIRKPSKYKGKLLACLANLRILSFHNNVNAEPAFLPGN